jgi:hypothetical protein
MEVKCGAVAGRGVSTENILREEALQFKKRYVVEAQSGGSGTKLCAAAGYRCL